jgi:serine/threonine-protein kinase
MDAERWHRLEEIFQAALELPEEERAGFIDRAADRDAELAERVRAMLEADGRSTFLDADMAALAGDVLVTAAEGSTATSIGPYRIKSLLGEGGSGVVYSAARDDIGHAVAIKVLRDAWVSAHRRERFHAEQQTLARLNHPAIARIFDAGVLEGGTPWFAMELVGGTRLDEYCRAHVDGVQPLARLFRTICGAVQHAHERLVVHRDLKPSNILVTADGQPKLLDFGIARQIEQLGAEGVHTGPLRVLTPRYAAPEELRGEVPGVRSDVYSLGRIFGELMSDLEDRRRSHAGWALPWNQGFERSRARDVRLICATAAHDDPERRYASVEALARDLDAVLAGRPIRARPPTIAYRTRRFVGRNFSRIAAAAVVLAVLGGLSAAYAERLRTARAATTAAAARSERLLGFMLGLFEGGDRGGAPAADLRVVSLLERGVQEARALGDDPGAQTEMFHTLGRVYQQLGDLETADRLLTDAYERRLTRLGDRPDDIVASLVALSELRLDQARLEDAQRLADEAAERASRWLGPAHPARIDALTALGRIQREKGDYAAATATLGEAVAAYERVSPDGPSLTDALSALAETRFYVGDLDGSEALSNRALELTRRLRGGNHPDVGHIQLTLSAIATSRGQHADAERLTREALQILVSWFGEDHPESASAMTILAQSLGRLKRYDEARALLQKAIVVQERTFGVRHPRTAFVQHELGFVALQSNDLESAAAAFERAADAYGASAGTHFQQGASLANLGTVHMTQGDNARAERMFRRALEIYAEVLPADHVNVGIAQAKLGRALLRQKRSGEAETTLRQAEAILSRQPGPESTWLKSAREDLTAVRHPSDVGREPGR